MGQILSLSNAPPLAFEGIWVHHRVALRAHLFAFRNLGGPRVCVQVSWIMVGSRVTCSGVFSCGTTILKLFEETSFQCKSVVGKIKSQSNQSALINSWWRAHDAHLARMLGISHTVQNTQLDFWYVTKALRINYFINWFGYSPDVSRLQNCDARFAHRPARLPVVPKNENRKVADLGGMIWTCVQWA